MAKDFLPQIERNVARCRVVLSVASLLAIYVDPTEPAFGPSRSTPGRWFSDVPHARTIIEAWRVDYNEVRPHSALGNVPPRYFAEQAA